MLLAGRTALVYGGAGALGAAAAHAFAREGATVHLAGRTAARLEQTAGEIRAAGGRAAWAIVDALDEAAVERHAELLDVACGGIDVALVAVGIPHVQGTPLADLGYEEFAAPLVGYARCHFLTMRAVGRRMAGRGRGVFQTVSTPGARMALGAGYFGIASANATVETMTRHLAAELGPSGVRVLCLRPHAIPEALAAGSHSAATFQRAADAAGLTVEQMLAGAAATDTPLRRLPTLAEFGDTAAFMASDRASAITAAIVNLSCGAVLDL